MRALPKLLLAFACTLTGVLGYPAHLNVVQSWGNHFKAKFCLSAPFNIYGWELKLTFSHPVHHVRIWDARVVKHTHDKKTYILSTQTWNQKWLEDETRCMELIGQVGEEKYNKPTGSIEFNNLKGPENCRTRETGQGFDISIVSHWKDGIHAEFCLSAPQDLHGWRIRLEFSKKIPSLTVWNAKIVHEDTKKQVYILSHQYYNSDLKAGKLLCLSFLAHTHGKFINPCIDAYFVNRDNKTPLRSKYYYSSYYIPRDTTVKSRQIRTIVPPMKVAQTEVSTPMENNKTERPSTNAPLTDAPFDSTNMTRSSRASNKNQAVLDLYHNVFSGDGTYYGAVKAGTCTYGDTLPPAATNSKINALVALNKPQFMNSLTCGLCLKVTGKGDGLGATPITGEKIVFVKDLCPECVAGDVDFALDGDGRWKIQIQAVQCPVGNTKISYTFQGSNAWYLKLQVRNARIPITKLELKRGNTWHNVQHSADGYWVINDGHEWPTTNIPVRLTAANGQVLTDIVPKLDNNNVMVGLNKVQVALDNSLPHV